MKKRTYRAFISYSHRDAKWGKWLQTALESYKIPKDMIGEETDAGVVPGNLRPVFRDRLDLAAGPSLQDRLDAALEASENLIVICSPSSAHSDYVNEEVRRFKALGKADRIFALIVDGTPGDGENGCFPEALRYKVDRKGNITRQASEPVGADVRAEADGKDLAKLKIISGLLGLDLDALRRREEIAERRRKRVLYGVAATMSVLAVVATATAAWNYFLLKENQSLVRVQVQLLDRTLDTATKLVDQAVDFSTREGIPASMPERILRQVETMFKDLEATGLGQDSQALKAREAIMMLRLAENRGILGDTTTREQYVRRAITLLEQLTADPTVRPSLWNELAWGYTELGVVLRTQGSLTEASQAVNKGLKIRQTLVTRQPDEPHWKQSLSNSHRQLGHTLREQGALRDALGAYRKSLSIKTGLLKTQPDHRELKSELAAVRVDIGDVLRRTGEHDEALASLQAGLALQKELIEIDQRNANWQRDVSVTEEKIGDLHLSEGKLEAASESYRASFEARARLAAQDTTNPVRQSELAYSFTKLGSVHLRNQKPELALEAQLRALEIRQKLHAADETNADWTRVLGVSHRLVGEVHAQMGRDDAAIASFRRQRDIIMSLLDKDASKFEWKHDLAVNHTMVADRLFRKGDREGALAAYEQASQLYEELGAKAPSSVSVHHNRFTVQTRKARLSASLNQAQKAVVAYEAVAAAADHLATLTPDPGNWQERASIALAEVGELKHQLGDMAGADEAYGRSLDMRIARVRDNPEDGRLKGKLALRYLRTGEYYRTTERCVQALEYLNSGKDLAASLASREPNIKTWQEIANRINAEIAACTSQTSTQ